MFLMTHFQKSIYIWNPKEVYSRVIPRIYHVYHSQEASDIRELKQKQLVENIPSILLTKDADVKVLYGI